MELEFVQGIIITDSPWLLLLVFLYFLSLVMTELLERIIAKCVRNAQLWKRNTDSTKPTAICFWFYDMYTESKTRLGFYAQLPIYIITLVILIYPGIYLVEITPDAPPFWLLIPACIIVLSICTIGRGGFDIEKKIEKLKKA